MTVYECMNKSILAGILKDFPSIFRHYHIIIDFTDNVTHYVMDKLSRYLSLNVFLCNSYSIHLTMFLKIFWIISNLDVFLISYLVFENRNSEWKNWNIDYYWFKQMIMLSQLNLPLACSAHAASADQATSVTSDHGLYCSLVSQYVYMLKFSLKW
jgi:hypothetical protein